VCEPDVKRVVAANVNANATPQKRNDLARRENSFVSLKAKLTDKEKAIPPDS
jgi:hypothetical protein